MYTSHAVIFSRIFLQSCSSSSHCRAASYHHLWYKSPISRHTVSVNCPRSSTVAVHKRNGLDDPLQGGGWLSEIRIASSLLKATFTLQIIGIK